MYFLSEINLNSIEYVQSATLNNRDTLFQVGTVFSLLNGVYEGDITLKTLALHGDTGLGTFNEIDGELIALDGHFYRIDAEGIATEVSSNICTPFAVVSHFQPTIQFTLHDVNDIHALGQLIDSYLPSPDIFYMVRIEAELDYIHFRSEVSQSKPYRPLAETFAEVQKEFELQHSYATLVGLKAPAYCSPLNAPGYHFHFIDQDRKTGGHVFDLKIINATISIQPLCCWVIVLTNNDVDY